MSDKNKEKTHINELLCYATFYQNNSTVSNIKKMIEIFYTQDEIIAAKKLLWDLCGNKLGPYHDRKTSPNRTGSSANIDDIFEALTKIDSCDSVPTFVALNVDRVPDRQPEELNLVMIVDRLSNIEKLARSHDDAIISQGLSILELQDMAKRYGTNTAEGGNKIATHDCGIPEYMSKGRFSRQRPNSSVLSSNSSGTLDKINDGAAGADENKMCNIINNADQRIDWQSQCDGDSSEWESIDEHFTSEKNTHKKYYKETTPNFIRKNYKTKEIKPKMKAQNRVATTPPSPSSSTFSDVSTNTDEEGYEVVESEVRRNVDCCL